MTDRESLHQLLDRYAAAVLALDVDAFVDLYDAEVRVFDQWDEWSYDGAGAWRRMAQEWFGSLGAERVSVRWHDAQVCGDGDLAAVTAFVTFTGLAADGEQLRSTDSRLTWVVRRDRDGRWKVVHEHTSAPVDVATAKALLRR